MNFLCIIRIRNVARDKHRPTSVGSCPRRAGDAGEEGAGRCSVSCRTLQHSLVLNSHKTEAHGGGARGAWDVVWGSAEPEWPPGSGVECRGQFGVGHPELLVVPEAPVCA